MPDADALAALANSLNTALIAAGRPSLAAELPPAPPAHSSDSTDAASSAASASLPAAAPPSVPVSARKAPEFSRVITNLRTELDSVKKQLDAARAECTNLTHGTQ